MGLFSKRASTVVYQQPVVEPPSMTPEQVLQHAGFERGWKADTIWAVHQHSGVLANLFKRYGYSPAPVWCEVQEDSINLVVDGHHVGRLPKTKFKKVSALGNRVPALGTISDQGGTVNIGVHIKGL